MSLKDHFDSFGKACLHADRTRGDVRATEMDTGGTDRHEVVCGKPGRLRPVDRPPRFRAMSTPTASHRLHASPSPIRQARFHHLGLTFAAKQLMPQQMARYGSVCQVPHTARPDSGADGEERGRRDQRPGLTCGDGTMTETDSSTGSVSFCTAVRTSQVEARQSLVLSVRFRSRVLRKASSIRIWQVTRSGRRAEQVLPG